MTNHYEQLTTEHMMAQYMNFRRWIRSESQIDALEDQLDIVQAPLNTSTSTSGPSSPTTTQLVTFASKNESPMNEDEFLTRVYSNARMVKVK